MKLSEQEVRHVAQLAHLALSEAEVAELAEALSAVLEHVQQLNRLDTDGVPPTETVLVQALPKRPDQVAAGLTPEQATREAPRSDGSAFAVPAFVGEG